MKKFWVNLLAVLLFAALYMTCACAEVDEGIILGDASDLEVQVEATDDEIILEDDLSMDVPELPVLGENDGIAPDLSLEDAEAVTASQDNAVKSNADAGDFEIINGILVKYKGEGGYVVIPDGVTIIGEEAFDCCTSLTGVTIPDSVTSIGDGAFNFCTSLTSVTIPGSVTSIGDSAFDWCTNLTSVTIPNSVTSIGRFAFSYCSNLTSVTIPNSVTSLEYQTFYGCSNLTSVSIPNSVTNIGLHAFSYCSSLTSINIPNSVTCIDFGAFQGCSSLTSISIPNSVTRIGGLAFNSCSRLTSVSIGSRLTYIPERTFDGCMVLERVVLPANLCSIGDSAFKSCYSLMDVTLLNGNMNIDNTAFSGCPTTMTFHTPCDSATTKWAEGKGYKVVKSDHTPVTDPAIAPTCAENGLTEGTHCSVCDAIIKAQEVVPALAHTPVTDPAVDPTIFSTGLTEGSHCSVCGEILVKQQTVPKLISLKKCKITGIKDAVYTGKSIKPAPVVKYNGKKLVKGVDYTVKYTANKAVGAATVTVTGIGRYGESVSKTFKINPKAVALSKLTAGKRQLTVTWKKGKNITGYQVQYSLKKSFSAAKTVTIKKAATVKTVLKNLTTGKTYYVRIRAYKTVNGKKYFSAWSKAKSAKVK